MEKDQFQKLNRYRKNCQVMEKCRRQATIIIFKTTVTS